MSSVELRDVTKVYDAVAKRSAPTVALEPISLSITDGEFVALLGPSGCGKSTLLNMIAGLITATSGTITVDSKPVVGPGPDRAMVFQQPSLLPWRTTQSNIRYGLEMRMAGSRAERDDRVRWALDLVGLSAFANHYPHQLSGGMQQRVNLARAIATMPQVLLMDEPFGSLDAITREQMQGELLRIRSATACTVVFVTHDISEALFLSDRVVVMTERPGRVRSVLGSPFERPRSGDIKRTPGFIELEGDLWQMLQPSSENLLDHREPL